MGTDATDFYEGFSEPLFSFPVLVLLILILLPVAAFLGFRFGVLEHGRLGYDKVPADKIPGGTSLGAMLALLGLLLGFAFSSSINWREARKSALIEEAADIGSAFLSADLLATEARDQLQPVILAYAETRIAGPQDIKTKQSFDAFLVRTREAQAQIWPATLQALSKEESEPIKALVARSVMNMFDAHTRRIAAAGEHIPKPAMIMIVAAAIVAIAIVGNRSALQGRPLTWRTFTFAGVLSIVILVIFDLARSLEGSMRENYDPMLEVIYDMDVALAQRNGGT
ncbi:MULTISPECIES: hypothetical protein [unclassified Ruegeria]|uniref:bestrophin-like domain n=1 Tax=unclassified Ruegeria TaxID=2625375 RepID=UPI001489998A|nr:MULTISPECIES: hypothetical protein [unclassified Ruegeria]